MHPSTQGATMVYDQYLLPLFADVEVHIKKAEKLVEEKSAEAI